MFFGVGEGLLLGELEGSWVDEACGQGAKRDRLVASLFHKESLPYPPLFSNTLPQ